MIQMPHMTRFALSILTLVLLTIAVASCANQQPVHTPQVDAIPNLHPLTDRLYSGGEPVGQQVYQQLAGLGIQTVISVDAVAPDQALADKYSIRVIHLPIGYDGIDADRAAALTKALVTIDGPIYLHCHHGKHRGPAALAVGAIGAGEITNEQGRDFLVLAGTSKDYPGLWDAVADASPMDRQALNDESITLPAAAEVGDFLEVMSSIDRAHEDLWICADNGFVAPPEHPDLAPASLARQIRDGLQALEHDPLVEQEGGLFAMWMEESAALASRVEAEIIAGNTQAAMDALYALGDSCVDCHSKYRD